MKRWRRSPGLVHERDTLRSLLSPWNPSVEERRGCFGSLIRNHCMNRGSNEIAAIKMMAVYMPRVLDIGG